MVIGGYDNGYAALETSALYRRHKPSADLRCCGLLMTDDPAGCDELLNDLFDLDLDIDLELVVVQVMVYRFSSTLS